MLHFSHLHRWDIESSPFGAELRRLGVAHRFLRATVGMRYRSVAGLLLRVYPLLAWTSLRTALASLLGGAAPEAMVVSSDVEALIYGTLRTLLRRRTLVVLPTLIVTPRRSVLKNAIYMAYWRRVIAAIDLGICHASAEVASYSALFPAHVDKFVFVPFGTTLTDLDALRRTPPLSAGGVPVIVTVGRSGRDYPLLARAIEGLPCRLLILCDVSAALADVPASPQVEVVRDRFGDAYLETLAAADFVAIPLAVDGVSAGQMVLLQAAAIGRAVIITRTATTVDYATDEADALLVPLGDEAALRRAVARLLEDRALRDRLGAAAAARFEREFSTEAYVRGLVAVIDRRLGR